MATYYGQLEGNGNTRATKTGSKKTGITTSAQSYDGSVIVWMREVNGENMVRIDMAKDSAFHGTRVFDGTLDELATKLCGKTLDEL